METYAVALRLLNRTAEADALELKAKGPANTNAPGSR
jgi:hypothetical protein